MNQIAHIGHNHPPSDIDDICAAYDAARMEAENWLDGTPVENEAQMRAVDALRDDMRKCRLDLERGQKAATAPLYEAYKAEGARWKPYIEDHKRIEAGLVSAMGPFKAKLDAEKAEAERQARLEAEQKRRAAEEAARQANLADIEAQRAAAAAQAEAEKAQRRAAEASRQKVKGLRTVTRYEVDDYRAALNDIAKNDRDAMVAFIDDYARRNHKSRPIAGVRVWEVKEAY